MLSLKVRVVLVPPSFCGVGILDELIIRYAGLVVIVNVSVTVQYLEVANQYGTRLPFLIQGVHQIWNTELPSADALSRNKTEKVCTSSCE
jgi:hypothetical protein